MTVGVRLPTVQKHLVYSILMPPSQAMLTAQVGSLTTASTYLPPPVIVPDTVQSLIP